MTTQDPAEQLESDQGSNGSLLREPDGIPNISRVAKVMRHLSELENSVPPPSAQLSFNDLDAWDANARDHLKSALRAAADDFTSWCLRFEPRTRRAVRTALDNPEHASGENVVLLHSRPATRERATSVLQALYREPRTLAIAQKLNDAGIFCFEEIGAIPYVRLLELGLTSADVDLLDRACSSIGLAVNYAGSLARVGGR